MVEAHGCEAEAREEVQSEQVEEKEVNTRAEGVRDGDRSLGPGPVHEHREVVEGAEVDPASESQRGVLHDATHFNPVDLVCGVRDVEGSPFDLRAFADPRAIIVTRKSHQGRELLAFERPGLWNGGMAEWITVFVEVPITTFTPVKTVMDLLRPEHQ